MREVRHVFGLQQGSSGTLRVGNQGLWYVVRETWEGARLLNTRIVSAHQTRQEAEQALTAARAEG